MRVEDMAARPTNPATTSAITQEWPRMPSRNGEKIANTAMRTASTLADKFCCGVTGAEAIRSGASSPDTASQASPPPSWPAAMVSTGASTMRAPLLLP
jgi:hypothetical protein